ncbi:peptidoglycan recognition family protein [Streptomyces sp. DH24]|uniref:peptidoglycan recognition protein family protein n=1 Tax=Streptomyces sp. DH24 TaxID=3040123 RepID=UPI002443527E|nr:peptidoglycan recognition family protein [Streptomyces sp. DH24]MDG9717393.1 peptidoglycan recognition family protein [Streptomyces sp. DH24]
MRLVTRAQWGARPYRTPNGATLYSRARRGVKLHYLGTAYSDRAHDRCDDYVRQIQAQHMDGNGWSDIGYSFVVCTHGYVYEGRGLKRRNSANGNTTLNEQDYAVLLMVGSSGLTKPTVAQLNGARDAIEYCRREGPAGTWLGGHRDGYATACPGDAVYAWVKAGAPRPAAPESSQEGDDVPNTLGLYDATDRPLIPKKWTTLSIDGKTDLLAGARAYQVMVQLTADLPEGATLQGRFYHHRPDGDRWTSGICERTGTAGSTFADFHNAGAIRPDERLRFEAIYWPVDPDDQKSITVTTSRARGLYWK